MWSPQTAAARNAPALPGKVVVLRVVLIGISATAFNCLEIYLWLNSIELQSINQSINQSSQRSIREVHVGLANTTAVKTNMYFGILTLKDWNWVLLHHICG